MELQIGKSIVIHIYQGKEFTNKLTSELYEKLDKKRKQNAPVHP
jgi:hypothetical protein